MVASPGSLRYRVNYNGYPAFASQTLSTVDILGVIAPEIALVTVNGFAVFDFVFADGRLTVNTVDLPMSGDITITWT